MAKINRRELLSDAGKGMVIASVGSALAFDLGIAPAWCKETPDRLSFGNLDPLVDFIQETPAEKLLPQAALKLKSGTSLQDLVGAAALANARTFGGEDYVGFHTLMALAPALAISREETDSRKAPLAVFKVLYRNATRLGEKGGATAQHVLKPLASDAGKSPTPNGESLRDTVRKQEMEKADQAFSWICHSSPSEAVNPLMVMVDDGADVHRIVLVSRSLDLIGLVGKERANTLLRQSVHYCVKAEKNNGYHKEVRAVLPKVLDENKLLGAVKTTRQADDRWVEETSMAIFKSSAAQAAGLVGASLREGMNPKHIFQAITLAANQLVLRDRGRYGGQIQGTVKPEGSVHGDSIGVHGCDSANAWGNIAFSGDWRTCATSLIMAGYQVARDRVERGGEFLTWTPYPRGEHLEETRAIGQEKLLSSLEEAVRAKNQGRAAALAWRLGQEAGQDREAFALLRKYSISEDGALHAEKFYRTSVEDYAHTRPQFRPRFLAGLARVVASAYGFPAPGLIQARDVLGV
ncbi:MAG: hypothetical protein EXR99_07465 [Gemmataceae bacterium]|nr:hypothetical protein [Gemmataceae bacterium]